MKTKKYILFALAALLTASCHDDGNWGQNRGSNTTQPTE